ncbi:MAG: 50S ribosomal protein L32 [bacterium]|nr:50S ribosomal protein L32 [bacterium]
MANPKRQTSKSKRDKRRTHWKITPVDISTCSQCGHPKLPHRVCLDCGFYDGRLVLRIEEKKEKK